ncbi:exonuclease SbcCD subunit D C-terminal domain-containing protein [Mycobacterium marinum]|uniref:exonuclease SbcCD subunit D C-terminal domain-containing protein n=1 Tax=Mycobacterium marinum TaxID=1781 RepID=UPI003569EF65
MTYRYSRAPDHEAVLEETIGYARALRPHLILHTGDLFDAFRPGYAEMARGIDALQELAAIAPVVVVAGNHDSPALFRLFNQLLGEGSRIRFIDQARRPEEGGVLEFPGMGDEVIRLAPLPFVHANRMVERFEDSSTWMVTYADRIHLIEDALGRGLREGYDTSRDVLLFAAHLYVSGARFCGSERPLHISDAYGCRLERLPQVSYAAFGHIHRPQALPTTVVNGRYAGSPICLDFGEEGEQKEIVIVEAEPGRPATVTTQSLSGGRPLRTLNGTFEEIRSHAPTVGNALCRVTVRTDTPTENLSELLHELCPEATFVDVNEDCAATRIEVVEATEAQAEVEPSLRDLFRTYIAEQGTRGADAKRVLKRFEQLLDAVDEEAPPRIPDLDQLLAKEGGT